MEAGLLRFLELVKRELGATDARVELGGFAPSDERLAWCSVPNSRARVVAVFDEPIADREKIQQRLENVARTFSDTIERGYELSIGRADATSSARARLDADLTALASRSGADRAAVFDTSSPMIWGASLVEGNAAESANRELERLVEELRSTRADELRSAHGHVVRLGVGDRECLTRMFGGLYVLVLSFKGDLSEPVAVGALLHAADAIERLVLALPPVDPPPGGKVIRLPRREG